MNLLDQIAAWLGFPIERAARLPEAQPFREALDAGRSAKFVEDYDRAITAFDHALELARAAGDSAAVTVVALHKAEVLTRLARYDDAHNLLESILHTARLASDHTQIAYILSALGELMQTQNRWQDARSQYEQALQTARLSQSSGAEGRALGHLADCYLHDGNASYAAHLLCEALPKLHKAGDMELVSYFTGRLGDALIQSGQDGEGQHLLGRAFQLAQQMRYRMFERMWALRLGERALVEARYHDAQTHFGQALRLFNADTATPEHARALCHMSETCLRVRDDVQALNYAQQAVGMSESLDAVTRAGAQGALGSALRAAGRAVDAIPHLQAAVEAHPADLKQVELLRTLAAAQSETGDPTAEATYRRALDLAAQHQAALEQAQCRRDLGLMYQQRGELQAAIQEWTAALAIYEERKVHAQIARLYCDLANARRSAGQGQRAIKDIEQALMTLNSVDDADLETRGVVLSNAANAYADQGDVESADAFFNETISIAEKTGDPTAEATRRGNYGWFLVMIGRPRKAISALENALDLSRKHKLVLQAAVQRDNLGLAYDALGDYPAALTFHRQALDQLRTLDGTRWKAVIKINTANTLLALAQPDEAQPLLDEALAAGRALDDGEIVARALVGLSRAALAKGQAASVDGWLTEAVNLARRGDLRRTLADALAARSEQQAALGNTSESASTWDEAQRLYNILRMPQGKTHPAWLGDKQVKS